MRTRRLRIRQRDRPHPIWIVKPEDFSAEPAGEIDPTEVFRDPKFSHYCFDLPNHAALFVESDDPAAVDRAPFYYQGQVEHAVGLVSMPIETFHRVTADRPELGPNLIFVHSVGRCGSTLVSKALQAIPEVHSLSEPDDLTQLARLRQTSDISDLDLKKLLCSSIRWRSKPRSGQAFRKLAVKPRSEVMVLADLLSDLYPVARHAFLYRDGVSWMRSLFHGWPADRELFNAEQNKKMEESWGASIPLVSELRREGEPMNPVQIRILAWITCMEAYLGLAEHKVPHIAARFEDLTANPKEVLAKLFEFCQIGDLVWPAIDEVLAKDSQAGTVYDREVRRKKVNELPDELAQDVRDLIATRPKLRVSDVTLQGTIRLV